ncbi:hypothetical protein QYE76_059874 [Lolium multiflorum]|uniref:Uncharacterized protein n=1 Tax=Lolium multiflorum TaxID=4521 RepID=A0AAD8RYS9_LOLMU|nr:hypothetical protein QYE76_059874 [Lolium multiflorum]
MAAHKPALALLLLTAAMAFLCAHARARLITPTVFDVEGGVHAAGASVRRTLPPRRRQGEVFMADSPPDPRFLPDERSGSSSSDATAPEGRDLLRVYYTPPRLRLLSSMKLSGNSVADHDAAGEHHHTRHYHDNNMDVTTDDSMSLSDDSGWSSSDDSDIEELLQDNDVEIMQILVEVHDFEDRVKLMDQRRGSKMGRVTIYRNRALGHEHLMQDYFAKVPTYPPRLFRTRYRMRCSLFVKIVQDCEAASDYFKHRRSAAGIMGFSGYQKISAAMRVLAYGIPTDYTHEYLRIGQDTTTESISSFVKLVIRLYGDVYLRAPNEQDTKRLMEMNEKRGWPRMLGSLDCMHWTWKNCPKAGMARNVLR